MNFSYPKEFTVFFSNNGLSNSDANHKANLAKEKAKEYESRVNNFVPMTQTIQHIGSSEVVVMREGSEENKNLKSDIMRITEYYSVCAYLRQAISAKNQLLSLAQNEALYLPEFTVPKPEQKYISLNEPLEEEVISQWSLNERVEYLTLEATAAHIGKFIHNGAISKARNDVLNGVQSTIEKFKKDNQSSDFVVKLTPTVSSNFISEMFFDLQKRHRDNESRLNWFKARIKNELTLLSLERRRKYDQELSEVQKTFDLEMDKWVKERNDWANHNDKLISNHQRKIEEDVKEISSLKIIIPDTLESVINSL